MNRFSLAALVVLAPFAFAPTPASAQMTAADLVMRLDRLEAQVRQLTGTVEQLQFRNQQLEQMLRAAQQDVGRPAGPPPRPAAAPPQMPPPQAAPQIAPPPAPGPQRRSDVFDPNDNPGAPGSPRTLGAVPPSPPPPGSLVQEEPQGRPAGSPLDLSTLSSQAVEDPSLAPPGGPVTTREVRNIPGVLPAPPPRTPNATAPQMVMAPTNTPKDEYDLAYGYVLRKDYALAEDALRAFLKKYPSDRLVADANYWLGETLFHRQRYRDAAESFLTVSTKFTSSGKAPEALLRLGQSLAALKEKEAACATFGEIPRKYPKAPASVKTGAEREQKRIGC
jgi:tol-pal system protein YbgF